MIPMIEKKEKKCALALRTCMYTSYGSLGFLVMFFVIFFCSIVRAHGVADRKQHASSSEARTTRGHCHVGTAPPAIIASRISSLRARSAATKLLTPLQPGFFAHAYRVAPEEFSTYTGPLDFPFAVALQGFALKKIRFFFPPCSSSPRLCGYSVRTCSSE